MRSVLVKDRSEVDSALKDKDLGREVRFRKDGSSFYYKNVRTLSDTVEPRCVGVGNRNIIGLFDKTPFPVGWTDVVCPHFMELKWANGCKYDCAWCYLNGTYRFLEGGKEPRLKDPVVTLEHLKAFLANVSEPTVLNSGELSDSLVFEGEAFSLTNGIVPLFQGQDRHKLMILTKSANVKGILEANAQGHVIVGFSVNSVKVAGTWERKAPSPMNRLDAAKKVADKGYAVRLRIDPMVPVEGWKDDYKQLVEAIFDRFRPERITLGTLRGLQSTINHSEDKSWVKYLGDASGWGKKIEMGLRTEMYSYIIGLLEDEHDFHDIAICKETVEMLERLGFDYVKMRCNCVA